MSPWRGFAAPGLFAVSAAAATVTTHLHRLFAKTGARRQAELVKLVAGFSSPFVA